MRRIFVPLAAVLAASALAVGTSSATLAGASVSAKAAPACAGKTKSAAVKAIKKTIDKYLNGTTGFTVQDHETVIQGISNPGLKKLFEDTAAQNAAVAKTTKPVVKTVTCKGPKKAEADAPLAIGSSPPQSVLPKIALVIDGGIWKISRVSACDAMGLGNPAAQQDPACQ